MKRCVFGVLCILAFLSCQNDQKLNNPVQYIPNDAALILQTPDLKNLGTELAQLNFLDENSLTLAKELETTFGFLKYTDSLSQAIISVSFPAQKQIQTTIILTEKPVLGLDSIQNKAVESIKKEGLEYQKIELEDQIFYASKNHQPYIISNSEESLIQLLKGKNRLNSENFQEIYAAIDPDKTSLLLNHERFKTIKNALFPKLNLNFSLNHSGWSAVDLQLSKKGIFYNGLSISKSEESMLQLLKDTKPAVQKMAEITPETAKGFAAFSYEDSKQFLRNLKQFRRDSLPKKRDEIILNSSEVGVIYLENTELLVLRTPVSIDATDLIAEAAELEENYRDYPIYQLKNPAEFESLLQPFFQPKNLKFSAVLGEALIFAETKTILRDLIADFGNENTLANQSFYKEATNTIAEASSLLVVGQTEPLKTSLANAVAPNLKEEMQNLQFGKHKLVVLQLVEEKDFAHIHGGFMEYEAGTTRGKTEEMLSVKLEADLLNEPVLVKNHLNNQMDIAVQDVNNTLYLISNKGRIFWKKKLKGPILGAIKQVDLFKNGRFQMAFATPYSLEVLDRNGKPVKPFPLAFKDEITQPLSLFDYDNNRKYRFLITQEKEVFMYDKKGKSVKGFEFKKTASEILSAPKHIRMGNKDYIVFPENSGKLTILNRRGSHRINVKKKIDFSENAWFEYNNDFISTNAEGKLVRVDSKGNVRVQETNLNENHKISARPNLLVSLSENLLKIKGNEVNLDYGLYTEPKIFYLNDKYYISLTDQQTQKVYLFDSNGVLFSGFPVYGTSGIDLNDADIDARPEFTVKGGEQEVLLYKL